MSGISTFRVGNKTYAIYGSGGELVITDTTDTTLNGVLCGNGTSVIVKQIDNAPTSGSNALISSGAVYAAIAQIDVETPLTFSVTLSAASWNGNAQTVSNANFLASGYAYIITPDTSSASNVEAYTDARIYGTDVSTDGQMTFYCTDTPTSDITVNILRMEATT